MRMLFKLMKMCEIMGNRRVEANPAFGMDEFLLLLFRFTFLQPSPEGFIRCLDVCEVFLDILTMQHEESGGNPAPIARPVYFPSRT